MLNWSQQFSILLFLDSNNYRSSYKGYECLLAAGAAESVTATSDDLLPSLQDKHNLRHDWMFGHVSYDYKNILEPKLRSGHISNTGFPLLHFFIPQTVCYVDRAQTMLTIASMDDPAIVYKAIMACDATICTELPKLNFEHRVNREMYIDAISKLRKHIKDGDCYEINFCTEGYCDNAAINPAVAFNALNQLSPSPFAAYYRLDDKYMMCSSPERYLYKQGRKVLSQPIKGTARRDKDATTDEHIKLSLRNDIKERAENVMIVDLVRNDLARCCETGSVKVDELFGVYTFPQVHQLISTVTGILKEGEPFTDALRSSFPMGSMTGAPKFKVMELIEQYEHSRRELFSGTVGYITPDGDFDFNVVIRSLFYYAGTKYLSYQTGGAITYDSDPKKEWEEMRLKAWALERIFM